VPRPDTIPGADGLPLWDTVEVVYFLVTGFSVGMVLGFLFPSLWRAFRRSFRKADRFAPDSTFNRWHLKSTLEVLLEEESSEANPNANLDIESGFVLARSNFQNGRYREAVNLYLEILGSEKVSKEETNRALFELAQTHLALGLQTRAFDTSFELLHRKPERREVMILLLDVLESGSSFDNLERVLPVWRGREDDKLRKRISHLLCRHGENLQQAGQPEAARETFMKAARRDLQCGRARIELWRSTSVEARQRCGSDVKKLWSALAADLEARVRIGSETGISPSAGSEVLASWLETMMAIQGCLESLAEFRHEFLAVLGQTPTIAPQTTMAVDTLLFHACVNLAEGSITRERSLEAFTLAKTISPSIEKHFPQLELLKHDRLASWIAKNLGNHTCQTCRAVTVNHLWKCPSCGSLETMTSNLATPNS
jgi:lipopolysaccharide biosynthesis regulator YciM